MGIWTVSYMQNIHCSITYNSKIRKKLKCPKIVERLNKNPHLHNVIKNSLNKIICSKDVAKCLESKNSQFKISYLSIKSCEYVFVFVFKTFCEIYENDKHDAMNN